MNAVSTSSPPIENLNPLPVGTKLQEFVIERALGIGGFGIVYQAHDTLLNRTVAIKEYMPTSLASRSDEQTVSLRSISFAEDFESGKATFIDEARMLARFKHPALIEVFRFWEQNKTAYMATPFYKGQTLKERLRSNSAVPHEAELKLILLPVLDALEHMHTEQVYHRDISPDNIMVTEDGTPILLDLGAARRLEEQNAQAFTVLVKPGYAPIEQYAGDAASLQGPWTDLYGWGATAYFALVGKPPPPSASRVMHDSITKLVGLKPPGYSHDFLAAIDATLAVRPDDRPQSVAELKMLLAIETPLELIPESEPLADLAPGVPAPMIRQRSRPDQTVGAMIAQGPTAPGSTAADSTNDSPAHPTADSYLLSSGAQSKSASIPIEQPASRAGQGNLMIRSVVVAVCLMALIAGIVWSSRSPLPVDVPSPSTVADTLPKPSPNPVNESVNVEVRPTIPATVSDATVAEKPASVRLAIKPWGEVLINGERRGVSPPLKALNLPAGEYNVEIRNGDYPAHKMKMKLEAGQTFRINHAFVDAASQ